MNLRTTFGASGLLLLLFAIQPVTLQRFGLLPGTTALAAVTAWIVLFRPRIMWATAHTPVSILMICLWLMAGFIDVLRGALGESLSMFQVWVIYLVCGALGRSPDALKKLRRTSRAVLALHAVTIAVQLAGYRDLGGLIANQAGGGGPTGFHHNPNGAALFVLVASSVLAALALRGRTHGAGSALDAGFVVIGMVLLSFLASRGAVGAMLGALAMVTLLALIPRLRGRSGPLLVLMVITGLVGFLSAVFWRGGSFFSAVETVVAWLTGRPSQLGENTDVRSLIWRGSLDDLSQSPWIGVPEITFVLPGVANAHNAFLDLALRAGVIVTAGFAAVVLCFLLVFLRSSFRSDMQSLYGICGATVLLSVILYSITHLGLVSNAFMWLIVGICAVGSENNVHAKPVQLRIADAS